MNANLEKVKIVVVGDSGVGKTSLVNLICHHTALKKSSWTIGCSLDVKLHEFKDGTISHKTYFIEFWDIGGSVKGCTNLFYNGLDGIIFVHDLTNRRSQDNLKKWLEEILGDSNVSAASLIASATNEFSIPPAIVIGTKLDEAQVVRDLTSLRRSSPIALEFRLDEINLDCMKPQYLASGSTNSIKLAKFFDRASFTF